MRRALAIVVFAGCAQGGASAPSDSSGGGQIDAPPTIDAPQIDAAPPIDGPMVDATPPADAPPIDSPPPPPDACVPMVTELLVNGMFDNAAITPWTEVRFNATIPLVVNQADTGFLANTGTQYAWTGGYTGNTADDYLYQNIVIPPMTTQLVLTGVAAVGTNEPFPFGFDAGLLGFLFPNAPATPPIIVLDLDDTVNAPSWTPFQYTFTQNVSGQTLRLQMESHNDSSYATSFVYDSLSLRATHGCP
jgi:hypothetical protein